MIMRTDLYQGHDYYNMDELLTEEHKLIRDTARAWVKQEVSPIIEDAAERCEFPKHLLPGLGEIGAFGPYIPEEYGGAGLDQIAYGLIMQELERCDSGLRSTASVQSSLVMYPIWKYGTEEQKQKFLPKLATGEWMGCFGLTEPDHGSNPGGMVTNYKEDGDDIILNGAKMWISNAPFAQVAVVWAKNEEGRIHGVIVERGMEGFSTPTMKGKWSLRASDTGSSSSTTSGCPRPTFCLAVLAWVRRSAAWTARATASRGAPSARPSTATTSACVTPRSARSLAVRLEGSSCSKRSWRKRSPRSPRPSC